MKSIGIIGFGNMGEAMINGLRQQHPAIAINVIEKVAARCKIATDNYQAKDFGSDYAAFVKASDIVVLAIKPQDSLKLLNDIKPFSKGAKIISILAGRSLDLFLKNSQATEIARFMPNLAASVGKSVTGISFSPLSSPDFRKDALDIANAMGSSYEIPENLMPAIVGVSGSGIAYVFEFIQAMAMGGTRSGLPYATSLEIAMDVLEGATATLKGNGIHPSDMTSRVCSPAGTTIEGYQVLADKAFTATVMQAVKAAANRAQELEA